MTLDDIKGRIEVFTEKLHNGLYGEDDTEELDVKTLCYLAEDLAKITEDDDD